jgi:hypothetical protein
MNCADVEERDIRARYVAGRLSPEDEQEFEAHLIDCLQCLDAVETETGLREGLRLALPGLAPPARVPAPPVAVWKAAPLTRFLQVAAALLLAVSIGLGAWLARTSGELRSARTERDESLRRAGQAEQSSAALEQRLAGIERRASDAAAAPPTGPLVPAAVFALTTVRGSSTADAAPVNHITIDRNARLVVFSVDLPAAPASDDYSVAVKDREGRTLWRGDTFPPSSPESLGVALDAKLLPAGDYILELQQRSPAGTATLVGRYPFRVVVA